jgi:hypothetical protein
MYDAPILTYRFDLQLALRSTVEIKLEQNATGFIADGAITRLWILPGGVPHDDCSGCSELEERLRYLYEFICPSKTSVVRSGSESSKREDALVRLHVSKELVTQAH